MAKILEVTRPACAGIDVGSVAVVVGYPDASVRTFETHTRAFEELIASFRAVGVSSVAMESTGVYGHVLFDMLREAGLEVFMVNPAQTKSRSGKKTDAHDSRWIQTLHSIDLLDPSFIPEKPLLELRHYVRHREQLIQDKSRQVLNMHKALVMMNIRLDTVLSQVHGASGLRMIEAILEGERDAQRLLELCDTRIQKTKATQVLDALNGFYQPQHLFSLRMALTTYRFIEGAIMDCEAEIEAVYEKLCEPLESPAEPLPKAKPIRHNKPQIPKLQTYNWVLAGQRDLTRLPGFTDYTLMQLMAEVGFNLAAFPSEKHFTSWLGLAPKQHQSGKMSRQARQRSNTRAGQIFRLIAQSVLTSKNLSIGVWARKIKARKGPAVAIKALARKLAVLFYQALTKGLVYVEKGIKSYDEQNQKQDIKRLEKMAKKLGFTISQSMPEPKMS